MSLRHALNAIPNSNGCFFRGAEAGFALNDLISGSIIDGRTGELRGRSVLIATRDPLSAALALIELDGVARRVVLCPADLRPEHLPAIADAAEVDAVVSDGRIADAQFLISRKPKLDPANRDLAASFRTEWVLLTSGTAGLPKLVVHSLDSLSGAIAPASKEEGPIVWSTFYDIRRYGGLQILLRAVLTGTSLVLPGEQEPISDFLARAGAHGVTHISGTPSHWRRALMSPAAQMIHPLYVRLSGEIADQTILNQLQSCYPNAKVAHAFASTEAGVAFEVTDGLAGFPASFVRRKTDVEITVQDDSLRIRSARVAHRYLAHNDDPLASPDGFVDTGDLVSLNDDRYYFIGRRDGVINVGGLKVHPEEVEAVINRHPVVRMALVRTRRSPVTGAVVVADVVLNSDWENAVNNVEKLRHDIQSLCREALQAHKVPAVINFVPTLAVAETGKLMRRHA